MFKDEFKYMYQVFSEGHKLMTRGILFFGAFAVILSGLIFLFPAFIGALAATILLLAGLIALVTGDRFWKMGGGGSYNAKPFYPELESAKVRSHRPRHYHFQTIRFIRW